MPPWGKVACKAASKKLPASSGKTPEKPPVEIVDLDSLPMCAKDPLALFKIRESFRAALKDSLGLYHKESADGMVSVTDALGEDWEDWKDHADVQALPFSSVIAKCKEASEELVKFQKSIDTWTPTISVPGKVKAFRQLHSVLVEQIAECSEYHAALDLLNQQERGEKKVQKRREREARNKLVQSMVRGNVPTVVARASISTINKLSTVIQSHSQVT